MYVLRHGVVYAGHEKAEFALAFFSPASGLNPLLAKRYAVNRLTVTRRPSYETGTKKTAAIYPGSKLMELTRSGGSRGVARTSRAVMHGDTTRHATPALAFERRVDRCHRKPRAAATRNRAITPHRPGP